VKTTKLFVAGLFVAAAAAVSAHAGDWGYGGHGDCGKWKGFDPKSPYYDYVGSYCKEHGVKFSHGFFYVGKAHKHFTEKWHDYRFGIELFWDPHARSPYYWCEGHGVYYPLRYIDTVPHTAKGPGPVVNGKAVVGGAAPVGGGEGGAGAPAGGAGAGGAAAPAGGEQAGGEKAAAPAPAKPATAAATVAKVEPKKVVDKLPEGTFDNAVPEEP